MDLVEQWTVLGCQMGLRDNRPLVTLEHKASGRVFTAAPGEVKRLSVARSEVYMAGYLEGAADGIAGRVTALTLCQRLSALEPANDSPMEKARPQPELVPGG